MVYVVVKGDVMIFDDVKEAVRHAGRRDIILVVEGPVTVLRVDSISHTGGGSVERAEDHPIEVREGVNVVFDQMFRGFAEIIGREIPGVGLHEILGRGLDAPITAGRITRWPANDDYDVLKTVEMLAGSSDLVVFFTGDKKLARQAEALGLGNLVVSYMPPNEYPGKESLARAMIRLVREHLGGPSP